MKKYRVKKEYVSPYPDSILFKKDEHVKPGKEYTDNPNWENWIWCEGQNNNKAWVPQQFLIIDNSSYTLNRDYDALELSVVEGEELVAVEEVNGFIKARRKDGRCGWVPMENLDFLENL